MAPSEGNEQMIDAYQAAFVAYYTGDGELIHDTCAPIRGTSEDWQENAAVMEDHGYSGVSRYSIHEIESENWNDLEAGSDLALNENTGTDCGEWMSRVDADVDYQDERIRDDNGEWHDVSAFIAVTCAECSERIN